MEDKVFIGRIKFNPPIRVGRIKVSKGGSETKDNNKDK